MILDIYLYDLLSQDCTKEFEMRVSNLITKGARPKHIHRIITEMVKIQEESEEKEGQRSVLLECYWRLYNIARGVAWPTIIEVIIKKANCGLKLFILQKFFIDLCI